VVVAGKQVGTVMAGHARGGFLRVGQGSASRELDRELGGRLDRRLMEGAVLAAALALLLGLVLAFRLTRPLERLTAVARRMAHGEIETRAAGVNGSREAQELGRTLDRLAAALRRQDELRRATIADVSHEMRNALVGVIGRLEALQDGIVLDERTALARMERDARRLHRLVDDVVALAEAQRPSLLVRKAPVDLEDLARERVAAHADAFAARRIALRSHLRPACVEGDGERLVQIVDNLLSNALRYTDPGGRVDVRLRELDGHVQLEVADTGIGIAPEHLGRVFDRFWRDPAARERVAEGSGVGLALVRDLVLAHDGRVEVESRRGEGTAFRVVLPAAPEPEPQLTGAPALELRTA
jgi:two-component system sensor histidine kinase BaeS